MIQPVTSRSRPGPKVHPDEQALRSHVRALSEELGPRDYLHPENLDRVAGYIRQRLEGAGAEVSEQTFEVQGRAFRNVRTLLGPATPERVVVGAHYDSAGPLPGADDNASGVAGLLELARLLAAHPPPIQVELVAYSLEEPPFFRTRMMGSATHASALIREGVRVRAMLSLEMIGCFDDARGSQRFPARVLSLFYPSEGNFIAVVGNLGQASLVRQVKRAMRAASTLPAHSINAPRLVPGIDLSDHASYWNAGFPAVMITDTAFYRNERYHTADDTADRLDYRRMGLVVEGVFAAVHALAE
ncbi:MAG: M28 family peptidase [Myxococcales bacterium]|nr:M28 family peptidase [Myxococcales bacterium]